MIAAEHRINGHQYQLPYFGTASVVPSCACGWTGTPWRPETSSPARIEQAAREWHTHATTARPVIQQQEVS